MNQACLFLPPEACDGAATELEVHCVQQGTTSVMSFAAALERLSPPWRLVLPVEAVTACAVQLPTQKARWLRQALPFAVEELLAEDVERFHLALGASLADGRHRVFAVRRDWLESWLALCGDKRPGSIQVDADLLPDDGTRLGWLDGRWLLGGAGSARLALASEDWPALAANCPPPRRAHAPREQARLEDVEEQESVADMHAWLAGQRGTCELAQAEFAVREPGGHWQRWRPLLGLLGLWLLLQWGFNLAQGWYLQREGERYAAASADLYRELFPEDTRLVNLRHQFDQHLAEASGSGQGHLLGLLGQASDALLAEGGQLRVQQMDFSEGRGDLALQVQAPGFDALERLRQRLLEAGLSVQLGSASREEGGVSARLVIGG
ncbi:type II secretion system protein GspL [Zestomonas carbonaria]|uniref:Type II secretion system protein L n=1 Tax=Zestomonas carbonaria TaxID=2762745 RepID=A0A7U7IAT3_9GAMM|nr:type II secretion system protein GspL [Pseudomonas carbonaria]CAD5109764.1 Type II secretion system protein L [Pseudomonas carbonaria]